MKKLLLILLLFPAILFGQSYTNLKVVVDKPSGGTIIADTLKAGAIGIKQTTAGQRDSIANYSLSVGGPTTIYVSNIGTVSITLAPGGALSPGGMLLYRWTGAAWSVSAGSGGGTWGTITGSIGSQTDLQNKFNSKQDTGTALLKTGGAMSGDINMAGNDINNLATITDGSSFVSINASSRNLYDNSGNLILTYTSRTSGLGITTGTHSANLKTGRLAADRDYQFPDSAGTFALKEYLPSLASVAAKRDTAQASGTIVVGQSYGGGKAVTPSGDVTINNSGVTAIGTGKVTNAMLADSDLSKWASLDTSAKQNYLYDALGNIILNPNGSGYVKIPYARSAYSYARVNSGTTLFSFGDSFTAGTGASTTAHNYVNVLNDNLGATANNQGAGGKGWYQAIVNGYTNLKSTNIITPSTVMVGLNDWRRGGDNSKTYAKGQSCARAFLANHFLASAVAANDASVSTTGTWTTTSGIGDKASLSLSGLVRTSSVIGSTLTWTFSGESLVIGCFSTDQVANFSGSFSVTVDGVSQGTYSGKNKTDGISDGTVVNSIVPNAFVLLNLGTGSHTVVITTLEAASTRIDYFGTLNNPQNCAPVIIASTPKMTALGYAKGATNTPPINLGSDVIFNRADSNIRNVISEFRNYPIYWVDINSYWNISTDISTDTVHPSDLGHSHIANGFLSAIDYGKNYQTQNPIGLTDNSASANMAWFGNNADAVTFGINRRPGTGVFYNTAKTSALIQMTGAASNSHINFLTSATNNTTPTERMVIDKNGLVGIGQTVPLCQLEIVGATGMRIGNSTSDNGGYINSATSTQLALSGGSQFNGTNTIAKATSASQVTMSTGAIIFKSDTSLTVTGTFTPTERMRISPKGAIVFPSTNTATGTTGNQTINKPSGSVNIAASGTTVTVTNSLVTSSSLVFAVVRTNDSTALIKNVVPGSGSFVINMNAAVTAETSIGFWVIN